MKLREIFESFVDEGDVISNKFQQKLQQKKGMYHNPDLEPPKSRSTGEEYVRFETVQATDKISHIIGILADGRREQISTTQTEVANVLVRAYNAGGMTDKDIKRIHFSENGS